MKPKKEKSKIPQEKLDSYDKLILAHPEIERKGATIPYTSYNGHMFSYFDKEGSFGLRLPAHVREEFVKKYNTQLLVSYGVTMKEYVVVPDDLLKNTEELKLYFDASFVEHSNARCTTRHCELLRADCFLCKPVKLSHQHLIGGIAGIAKAEQPQRSIVAFIQ